MKDEFNKILEDAAQINAFQRAAKKKSSLKTSKSNYKEIHARIKDKTGTVKIKKIKFENESQPQQESKPLSTRKKLDESNTIYKKYVILVFYPL